MTTTAKSRQRATKPPRVIDAPFVNLDELPDDRLTASRLYEIELYNHSFLAPSVEEARSWAALARAGDTQAREDMVVACLRYVFHVGHALAIQGDIRELAADIVAAGNVSVMERLEKAYDHISPFGYLMTCAKFDMARWARQYSTLITLPGHPNKEKRAPSYQFFSLDVPGPDGEPWEDDLLAPDLVLCGEEEKDFTPVLQAVEELPEKRREVVTRRFGLFDTEPQRLADINRAMYGRRGGAADMHLHLAMKSLRCNQVLRELVPVELSPGESSPVPRKRGRPAKARKDPALREEVQACLCREETGNGGRILRH